MPNLQNFAPSRLNLPEAVAMLTGNYDYSQEHAQDLIERAIHGRSLRNIATFHPDGAEVPTDVTTWREIDWARGTVDIEPSWAGSPAELVPVVPLLDREEFVKTFEIDAGQGSALARQRWGRPAQYDWDEFWVKVCWRIYDDGWPATRSELVDEMEEWFIDRGEENIDRRTIEKKAAKLFGV